VLRLFIVLSLAAALVLGLSGLRGMRASAGSTGAVVEVDQAADNAPVGPGFARHPLFLRVTGHDARGRPLFTNSTPSGYTPSQIQSYLGLTGDGSGQTIAIVDAYDDPNIASDLNTFSSTFGLPPANFTKATPQGQPRTNSGWSLEIALDVEWAHAVAPKANILLVEAKTNSFSNLLGAIDYAAQQGAVVISNSWGAGEFSGETSYDSHCNLSSAVCTFSSGDSGNPGGYPAYNPYAVAVGGTTLKLDSSGSTVSSETAWSGSGGGVSKYEPKPSYQNPFNTYPDRGMPDVSYDADPNTGFPVYDTVSYNGQTGWFQVGGTSAGAPQWAAIIAAADQLRGAPLTSASFAASSVVYALSGTSALYDVTSGSNGSCGSVCQAGIGYDFVTGLGSPRSGIDAALAGGSIAPTATATATPSGPTNTPTPTNTPSPTNTPAPPTNTPTATNTPSGATPTNTPCPRGWYNNGRCVY
jgi:subtilase family serine protease